MQKLYQLLKYNIIKSKKYQIPLDTLYVLLHSGKFWEY